MKIMLFILITLTTFWYIFTPSETDDSFTDEDQKSEIKQRTPSKRPINNKKENLIKSDIKNNPSKIQRDVNIDNYDNRNVVGEPNTPERDERYYPGNSSENENTVIEEHQNDQPSFDVGESSDNLKTTTTPEYDPETGEFRGDFK